MVKVERVEWVEARPRVALSRCLEMAACRYDGEGIRSPEVRRLDPHVEWVPVCPEVGIGLGVPRAPIRVESSLAGLRLVQPSTGRDLTARMRAFSDGFADGAGELDGVVLKSRSPSCGLGDVKVYEGEELVSAEGTGRFAAVLRERYPGVAMVDEVRLADPEARHHWLTRAFASARLRAAATADGVAGLVDFHTRYKLVLMAYSPGAQRALGRLVAAAGAGRGPESSSEEAGALLAEYRRGFEGALSEPASRGGHVNAIQHAQGYFKADLGVKEKRRFLELQAEYLEGRVPIGTLLAVLARWVERLDDEYLADQLYLRPYAPPLLDVGRGAAVPRSSAEEEEGDDDPEGGEESGQAE